MTRPQSLPAHPSLESIRKQAKRLARDVAAGKAAAVARMTAQLPKAGPSLSQRDAQLVIAREHGFVGWRDLKAKVLERSGQGLEWAFDQARRAIHERNVERLKQLIEQYPALLSQEEGRCASLVAATLPFLLDAAAHQQTQTRPECLELLVDAGVLIGEDVWEQLIGSRSVPMLELLQRKGVLPDTLAIRATLGDVSAVRACLDDSGALRPFAFSRGKSELESVNQAFSYACRNAHAAAATVVLQRCIALDPALAPRIDGWQGRAAFVAYMCEHLVGVVRDSGESLPPWIVFVLHQLERSIGDGEMATFRSWLEREPYLLGEGFSTIQERLIHHAVGPRGAPFIEELFARAPAFERHPPPPSRVVSHAVEYGHAHLVPLLARVWPVPDDLPHAAGLGKLDRVRSWFDANGQPALGNPLDHHSAADATGRAELIWADNHVQQVLDIALGWACMNRELEIAAYLLEHGADINTRWGTHEPSSILHECAMSGNYESARFLIDRGIDMTLLDYRYRATAEGWARHGAGNEAMAIFLAEAAAARKSAPPHEAAVPALLEAAASGSVQEVQRVLDAHPGIINGRGGRGQRTALHAAAVGGHLAVAELLLERGADPTIRDVGDYATALHWAAERGSLPLVKLLVEAGADVIGYGDLHDWTVLGWAMSWKTRPELAQYLLEQGAEHTLFTAIALGDLNAIRALATPESINKPLAVFERGRRPLHVAVLRNQAEAATLLLQLGADPKIPDLDGLTPLDYAALRQWKELSQHMIDAGAELRLPAAVALGRSDVVRRALAADPDAFKPTGRWGNLIARASGFATADVINALLDHGASVEVRVDGRTPLHFAAWDDNVGAIQALVAHGAPLGVCDDEHGGTPLGFAEHNGNHAAAAMLRELGAVH